MRRWRALALMVALANAPLAGIAGAQPSDGSRSAPDVAVSGDRVLPPPPPPRPMAETGWISGGDPRPVPPLWLVRYGLQSKAYGCLEAANPLEPLTCSRMSTVPPTTQCASRIEDECWRDNWKAILSTVGQSELTAAKGQRSYRSIISYALVTGWFTTQLDVKSDGSGTIRHLPVQGWSEPMFDGPFRNAAVSLRDVAEFEAALKAEGLDRVGRLVTGGTYACLDGYQSLFDLAVEGRYRWLKSGCGEDGEPELRRMTSLLSQLAMKYLRQGP